MARRSHHEVDLRLYDEICASCKIIFKVTETVSSMRDYNTCVTSDPEFDKFVSIRKAAGQSWILEYEDVILCGFL